MTHLPVDVIRFIERIDHDITFLNQVTIPHMVRGHQSIFNLNRFNEVIYGLSDEIWALRQFSRHHNYHQLDRIILQLEGRIGGIVRRVRLIYRHGDIANHNSHNDIVD